MSTSSATSGISRSGVSDVVPTVPPPDGPKREGISRRCRPPALRLYRAGDAVGHTLQRDREPAAGGSATCSPVIFYVTKRTKVIWRYLEGWGAALASQVGVLGYDELWHREQFTAGADGFTDFERLGDRELQRAGEIWASLERSPLEMRMLNNPHRALGRYRLLRTLRANGTNPYAAYRLHEAAAARFPVFVRREPAHGRRRCSHIRATQAPPHRAPEAPGGADCRAE